MRFSACQSSELLPFADESANRIEDGLVKRNMSADVDPDLALVRKLHLELNGSGRRTRGAVLPPAKKAKREMSRQLDEALKDTSSVSISGSGSGSGKVPKREGTLRRLVKKQPNSDSNQETAAGGSGRHPTYII